MRHVFVIGIGTGDPDHITVQAIKALGAARVVFIPDKGSEKADLRRFREEICRRYVDDGRCRTVEFAVLPRDVTGGGYRADVTDWHGRIADQYADLLRRHLAPGETGAFLVWGDPGLYDSTLRILDRVRARGDVAFAYEVIPGITSVQALAACHGIALNRIGEPVRITTGRRLTETPPQAGESVVVMLDGDQAFTRVAGDDLEIFWGAYLGSEEEILVSGPLREVAGEIERLRSEARAARGWIMDTYLLRKKDD